MKLLSCCWILTLLLHIPDQKAYAQVQNDSISATIKSAARRIMEQAGNCALITQDIDGFSSARTMDPFAPDSSMTVWLATNPASGKVGDIRRNNKVTLYYYDPSSPGYVTIRGIAELVTDDSAKARLWKPGWENFYKNRETDYILIKVVARSIEVVSYRENLLGDIHTWRAPKIQL